MHSFCEKLYDKKADQKIRLKIYSKTKNYATL